METHNVNVYSECPFDKLSQCRVTLRYVTFDDKDPFQLGAVCHSYHDGYSTCQKCILFFSFYVHRNGIPKEGEVVTPQIKS